MAQKLRTRPNLRITIAPRSALRPPLITERYDLLEPLGQGSTALVRRAVLRGSSQQFAVKTVHTEDPEMVTIVEKECHLLKSIRHPNIVQVVELIADRACSRVDIVMELISGLRLDALIKRDGSMSEDRARPLLVQLLRAVHHCHSHRVCHRDIKPENIMVSVEQGSPKRIVLMDFNAASRGGGLTPTGTRLYMSPEVWRESANSNEMRDMWSVGVCLFFMLAGFLPWIGERLHVVALEVSMFPLRLPAGLTAEADSLLQGLLCRDVACRLMVTAALAHPWCRLTAEEIRELFGMHDSLYGLTQPSHFNWEAKARKTVGGEAVDSGHGDALRKVSSWPLDCRLTETPSLQAHPSPGHSRQWYTEMPDSNSCQTPVSPAFRGWEIRMRREHLSDIYGEPILEPPYRNWEVNARRRELQVAG